ncbi:MAG: hypothetical protein U5K75_02660 [Ahrensia sp.]|nr:hypothetical protein [Ahrensia sp.]
MVVRLDGFKHSIDRPIVPRSVASTPVFISFVVKSEAFSDAPPLFIQIIMFLVGIVLLTMGMSSLRFVWKRAITIQSKNLVIGEIRVLKDDDADRSTETVHVRVNNNAYAVGADRSVTANKYGDGKIRSGEVWLDDEGKLFAIATSGEHFNTLLGGRNIPPGST